MPNIKSAKKRVRIERKKRLRNKMIKTNLKTTIKKAKLSLSKKEETSLELLKLAIKKIDKAVSKGIIHKNCAARKKSHLLKQARA